MTYQEILENAKKNIGANCKVCPVCNGLACRGRIPGPGGKGSGDGFVNSFKQLKQYTLKLDCIYEEAPVDSSIELFGRHFDFPFFAAPIGGLYLHYSDYMDDATYCQYVVSGCKAAGIAAFTGDGKAAGVFEKPLDSIKAAGGCGIPTVKPWTMEEMMRKFALAEECGAMAIATDVDAAGLQLLKNNDTPVAPKSVAQLATLIKSTSKPVIIKGVMSAKGALKALDAGAAGIVVSNHGGRVLDDSTAPVDVLEEIADAVSGKLKIFIDGGIRTGMDVFKVLALGADAALIGRPYVSAAYGGAAEGVELYSRMVAEQLRDTMMMTGAVALKDIDKSSLSRG